MKRWLLSLSLLKICRKKLKLSLWLKLKLKLSRFLRVMSVILLVKYGFGA